MNEKIPIKQLSLKVAANTGCTDAYAEDFIKKFFSLISDKLTSGESVSIDGLGTFTTGHSGDYPVNFIPDSKLANAVNAPFSMFEPEIINNNISEEMLDSISSDNEIEDVDEAPISVEITNEMTDAPTSESFETSISEDENDDAEDVPPIAPIADDILEEDTETSTTIDSYTEEIEIESPAMELSDVNQDVNNTVVESATDTETISDSATAKDLPPIPPAMPTPPPMPTDNIQMAIEADNASEIIEETAEMPKASETPAMPETPRLMPEVDMPPMPIEVEDTKPDDTYTLREQINAEQQSTTHEEFIGDNHAQVQATSEGMMKWFIFGLVTGLAIGALALIGYAVYFVNS